MAKHTYHQIFTDEEIKKACVFGWKIEKYHREVKEIIDTLQVPGKKNKIPTQTHFNCYKVYVFCNK